MISSPPPREPSYELFDPIASGGMAVVHLGRRRGAAGFSRVVAVKRLHAHLAADPDLVAMLMDEARLSARVRHTNVVSVLDVVENGGLALVMEYVHGAALSQLVRAAAAAGERAPPAIASAIVIDALAGLHAAHEATGDDGAPLHLVHRDVSPQNILVGADGAARIVDFGVAKARVRSHVTREGTLKGKLAYMAPEQLSGHATRRTDVLAAGIVLWELLAGRRLYQDVTDEAHMIGEIAMRAAPPLAPFAPELPPAVGDVVERSLRKRPAERFATADEMARAVREALPPAPPHEVGAWVERLIGDKLAQRAALIARIERGAEQAPPASGAPDSTRPDGADRTTVPDREPPSGMSPPPPSATETRGTVTIDPLARRGEAERKGWARRAWWLGAAALVLAAAGAVRVVAGSGPSGVDHSQSTVSSSAPSEAGEAPVQGGPASAAPAVSSVPEAAGAPAASTGQGSSPAPSSSKATLVSAPPRWKGAPAPSRSTLAAKPGCDPPWENDEKGIKRVKKGCLQ